MTWFGLADVPGLLAKNRALTDLADTVHPSLQCAVYALVAIHAAAAWHHHFCGATACAREYRRACTTGIAA